jgi:hypothetical protein
MSQLTSALSEGNSISARAAKLMWIICLLLWLSSEADSGARPELGFTPPIALQTASSEMKQAENRELKLGRPVEREIAKGQSHLYKINLSANQFLHVTVFQHLKKKRARQ